MAERPAVAVEELRLVGAVQVDEHSGLEPNGQQAKRVALASGPGVRGQPLLTDHLGRRRPGRSEAHHGGLGPEHRRRVPARPDDDAAVQDRLTVFEGNQFIARDIDQHGLARAWHAGEFP